MSDRIVILDTSTHRTVQELLPWFVMDRLSHDEADLVQRHLRLCTQCQADIEWQRKLQAATRPKGNAPPDVELALARLRPRLLTRRPRRASAIARVFQKYLRSSAPWMGWILAGQAVALAGCIFLLAARFDNGGAAAYRTLGALGTSGTQANVVAMFKPETSEAQLRGILQKTGARIVDGPTVGDFYLLNVPNAQLMQAINTLHAEPAIVLVEPLASGSGEHH